MKKWTDTPRCKQHLVNVKPKIIVNVIMNVILCLKKDEQNWHHFQPIWYPSNFSEQIARDFVQN